jgi:hypothetical protein
MIRIYAVIIILWTCASCQTAPLNAQNLPSATLPALPRVATQTPHAISTTSSPAATAFVTLSVTETPPTTEGSTVIGYSAGGRPLIARRFGTGERVLLLVGGMHGGWEANTVALMEALIDHFTTNPLDIPPQVSIIIVVNANPDGFDYIGIPRGRFNGNGVDLNRNWGCDWSSEAFWRQERVSAGLMPFSEPETQALQALMLEARPAAALFYHSAANAIFAGECEADSSAAPDGRHGSAALAAALGESTGYTHGSDFSAYPVTGTAASWADGQGIPAADVELATHTDSEFERNLRGIRAVMAWLADQL